MGKIRFNLRNPSEKGKTPIYMVYQDKSKPLVYPVGLYASAKEWDFDNYQFKGKKAIAKKSNEQLDLYKLELQTILLDMKMNGERFTPQKAKKALDRRFNTKTEDDTTIYGFAKIVHNRLKGTVNKSGLPRILQHIEAFDKNATFEEIDINFYNRFCDYLFDEQDFYRTTTNAVLTQLKRLWQMAVSEGITKNRNFQIIKKFKTRTDHVALDLNDIRKIYDYEITEKHLDYDIQIVKDIKNRFLLSCFTGLRRSDWNKIQKANIQTIDNEKMFVVNTQKTDIICAIPINIFPLTNEILKSYEGELPKFTPKQFNFVNRVIKDICEKAGLNKIITVTVWKRQKQTVQKQLFELISPHTARRTFVTTLLNKGFSENEIKKMTGHKSSASFSKYDKQKTVENAINVSRSVAKLKAI